MFEPFFIPGWCREDTAGSIRKAWAELRLRHERARLLGLIEGRARVCR